MSPMKLVIILFNFVGIFSFVYAATPTVDLKVNGGQGPVTVQYGTSVTLSWTSSSVNSCTASENNVTNWEGQVAVSGSKVTSGLSDSNVFTINCTSSGGQSASDSVVVNVRPDIDGPTVTLTVDDNQASTTIDYMASTTLDWTSTDTIFCTNPISNYKSGSFGIINGKTEGSQKVKNLRSTQTFTIICEGVTGKLASDTVTVYVNPQDLPEVDILADNQEASTTISYGSSTIISWTSNNTSANACNAFTIDANTNKVNVKSEWSGILLPTSGQQVIKNIITPQVFMISCKNDGGVATSSVVVSIKDTQSSEDPNVLDNAYCLTLTKNLRYRSRDESTDNEVTALQDFLNFKGLLKGKPTGFLGILTVKAIKQFQTDNNLISTGIVGKVTREKIREVSCKQ